MREAGRLEGSRSPVNGRDTAKARACGTHVMRIPDRLAGMLRGARHIAALTGAGISKESGLPTFREAQTGLWARFRPGDLATPAARASTYALRSV